MGKTPGPVKGVLFLQIVVCSTAGLSLLPASDLTVQNFSLVCDFKGASWTSGLLFYYNGNSAGGCGSPPNPTCASAVGAITTSNDQTATLTLTQSNILTIGDAEWTCTHASLPTGTYNASVIAVCSNGVVKQEDKKLDIRCSCGYPSVKATLEYKDGGDAPVNTVDLENSTSSGCVDTRAMDFSHQISNLPSAAKVCVAFTTLYQVSTPVEICIDLDVCPILLYAILPDTLIVLFVTLLVIGVTYHVGKDSKLQEGSLKEKCGCCPSDNKFCRIVCPLCTKPLCTGSDGGCSSGLSTTVKNIISVVVFTILAAVIGVIIAFGLGLNSGKCILALILSIVCGVVLVVIFIVSVYPHWPCLPKNRGDGGNCFNACRIVPKEETKKTDENDSGKKKPKKKPAENQDPPNRETPRSPQASASGIQLTTAEGRSPRPLENPRALAAIGSEAKQPPPISNEESTLKKKPLNTALPETPPNKLPPIDTVNNEEDKPKKKKKKEKKKRVAEENGGDDKRDSQNSGGQANVEEEEQK